MNHFDAQSHVHIQNKIENSVHSGFTVLKQIKMDELHGLITKIILPPT